MSDQRMTECFCLAPRHGHSPHETRLNDDIFTGAITLRFCCYVWFCEVRCVNIYNNIKYYVRTGLPARQFLHLPKVRKVSTALRAEHQSEMIQTAILSPSPNCHRVSCIFVFFVGLICHVCSTSEMFPGIG